MPLCLLTLMVSAELLPLYYMLTHTQNTASSDLLLGDSSVAVACNKEVMRSVSSTGFSSEEEKMVL